MERFQQRTGREKFDSSEMIRTFKKFWCQGSTATGWNLEEAVGSREGLVWFLMGEITTKENELEKRKWMIRGRGKLLEWTAICL